MNGTLLIARRELRAYLASFLGFVAIAATILGEGLYFNALGLGTGPRLSADVLREFFNAATGGTMLLAIVLSMRLLAGEREAGTLVLLNTAPIKDSEIVAGKFLAALGLLFAKLVLTLHMPLLIFVNGKVSVGHILVGYLGVLLLGAAALAIGMFGSALARTQVVAVVVGGLILAVFVLLWMVARVTDPPLNTFISALAIHHERQRPFMTGVLRLENVVYYVGIAYFFLLAATKTLEARRWR
jgi:ABC-2 type transport system permease protein